MRTFVAMLGCCLVATVGLKVWLLAAVAQGAVAKPYKVTIVEGKPDIAEPFLSVDPKIRVEHYYTGDMSFGVSAEDKRLTRTAGVKTMFMIDGKIE